MEQFFRRALWCTFLLYLSVSYVNTVGLASHFEPNWFIANMFGLAIEIGDVTLLLGTIKRKSVGKPYGGYLATFLVSLAVSIAANVAEWTNNFLGNDQIYSSLHEFSYPWVIPGLLGIAIPSLMLATGSMLSDFSGDKKIEEQKDHPNDKLPSSNDIGNGFHNINSIDEMAGTGNKEEVIDSQSNISLLSLNLNNKSVSTFQTIEKTKGILTKVSQESQSSKIPLTKSEIEILHGSKLSHEELFSKPVQELSDKYNVSRKTIYNWRSKAQNVKEPI